MKIVDSYAFRNRGSVVPTFKLLQSNSTCNLFSSYNKVLSIIENVKE